MPTFFYVYYINGGLRMSHCSLPFNQVHEKKHKSRYLSRYSRNSFSKFQHFFMKEGIITVLEFNRTFLNLV